MNQVTTSPSAREQARHALLLLGAPAPARRVVEVHRALFDGDLDMRGLAEAMRRDQPTLCYGLSPDLTPAHLALTEWPLTQRLVTPHAARAATLIAVIRIAEFAAIRPGAGRASAQLLRALAEEVPGGPEATDLAAAARAALDELGPDPEIETLSVRAAALNPRQQLFGVPSVPHQRDGS